MKKNILRSKVIQIFRKHLVSKKDSEICTDYLIKAELVEAKSHGLVRLKMYCDRLQKKLINPRPKIKIRKISSSISHIDADNSIGFVSADIGISQAIKNAKKTGIGLVAIKNRKHLRSKILLGACLYEALKIHNSVSLRKDLSKYEKIELHKNISLDY